MTNIFARSGKIALLSVFSLLFSVPAFSQAMLRKAMDFDQDGKADFVVFRAANPNQTPSNFWFVNKSGGGVIQTQFGLAAEDFVTPGDYDGDGKADIAVYRPSAGIWYMQQSTSGFNAVPFGIAEDRPTPNAFVY